MSLPRAKAEETREPRTKTQREDLGPCYGTDSSVVRAPSWEVLDGSYLKQDWDALRPLAPACVERSDTRPPWSPATAEPRTRLLRLGE